MKIVLLIFGTFLSKATRFEARFGILMKSYTIWTQNHRNRSYLDPFRGHLSILGGGSVPNQWLAKWLKAGGTSWPATWFGTVRPYLMVGPHGGVILERSTLESPIGRVRGVGGTIEIRGPGTALFDPGFGFLASRCKTSTMNVQIGPMWTNFRQFFRFLANK